MIIIIRQNRRRGDTENLSIKLRDCSRYTVAILGSLSIRTEYDHGNAGETVKLIWQKTRGAREYVKFT